MKIKIKMKIVLLVLVFLTMTSSLAYAADLDFFNPVTYTRHSFNSFVDSPVIFDDIATNFDDYLIEFEEVYYRVSEIQDKLGLGAANFEEAVEGLTPVDISDDSTHDYDVKDNNGKVLYRFQINSVSITSKRTEYTDKDPAQVLLIDITYKNISSQEEVYLSDSNFKIVDSVGKLGYVYPLTPSDSPQRIPVGASCDAQLIYGIDNPSETIKLYFYKNIYGSVTTSFTLPIE
jgi:hypothetical protein